jgi:cyclophilin family peptidyl-prolyl cis-trans isomerase
MVSANPFVDIDTNQGTFTLELKPTEAPITVANFLSYVDANFYDNTLFHRVIEGFMIQGGGYTVDLIKKTTLAPIILESNNGLLNQRGTVAMARTKVPNSATAEFFVNRVDNNFLNYTETTPGYAVFGNVVAGLAVVDRISATETGQQDIPVDPVIINTVRRRAAQLTFTGVNASYAVGDVINLSVKESAIIRDAPLDLWAAIELPTKHLVYLTAEAPYFTSIPTPFKKAVDIEVLNHSLLNFTIPVGLGGDYTFFAIFNQADQNIGDLLHSLRSNIATVKTHLNE